jgi:eukaryotic-like serine/threonine-protein kinase
VVSDEASEEGEPAEGAAPDSFDTLLRSLARTPQVLRAGESLANRRFQVLRTLGRGGMGVVYEALDTVRGGRVALKTLTRCGPQELYRLKHEFRSLADVAHPNLVALHEFFCDGDVWFFTMDLLEGESFLAYLRGHPSTELAQTGAATEPDFDEARLRSALRQLVQGVVALHQAGKLHCDLKPGNVLVGKTGHLTILDFGLVSERVGPSTGRTLGNEWAGTPGYMAPEQMELHPPSPATDYYAIGVMLYESLTGQLPFRTEGGHVLNGAQRPPAALPPRLMGGSTADLAALCLELLAADPNARPSEQSLIERACRTNSQLPRASVPVRAAPVPFVGREAELQRLLGLAHALDGSAPQLALIRGPSGIGKTRLAQEFVKHYQVQGSAVVLEGRCYERESVPFNAFDSLIDALCRYLRRLPELRAAALMPRDAQLLAELFPVLRRVASIDVMPGPSRLPSDPLVLRRRAFDALKELLGRIADAAPLVLCIDDMQWADADSLRLLEAIVSAPHAPGLLLLGLYLGDHEQAAAQVAAVCERQALPLHEIVLDPLEEGAAQRLIAEELALPEEEAARMARESNGNPFFLGELIASSGEIGRGARDLRQVIGERATRLAPNMRALVDLLCVAGAPIALGVALSAASLSDRGQGFITELRNERWLRLDPAGNSQRVEIYHDRIRRVLLAALSGAEQRRLHQRLAEALEARPPADDEVVALHWLEAGVEERAGAGFARAAARAEKNLAFVSAARLYGLALRHGRVTHEETQRLQLGMALSFERAGYASAAAQAYLDAAAPHEANGPARSDGLGLRRRAAQLLIASGALEAGIAVLRDVLGEVGLPYPEQIEDALAELERARQRLALSALLPVPAAASEQRDQAELQRRQADACWAAGPTLGSYDFVRAGYFAARGLELALETGDALRIARGLSMYATSVASGGDPAFARALAERALALATTTGDVLVAANAELVLGQVSLFAGDFGDCLAAADRALAKFRAESAGESLEVHLCNMFANMALHMSGRLPELVQRSRQQLDSARDCGHVQAEASLRVFGVALGHLADDEALLARQQGEISARLWPQAQLHAERFKVLRLELWCDLYEGQGARAFERFAAARERAQQALLLSSRYWSFWWFDLAAATALSAAACAEADERARLLAEAEHASAMLESMESKYVGAQLVLYRAAHAHLTGDADGARAGLRALCGSAHPLLAASAQVRLGALLGGPEGAALEQLGTQSLAQWVKSPARWVALMLPGFAGGLAR